MSLLLECTQGVPDSKMAPVRFYRANAFTPQKLKQLTAALNNKLKIQGSATTIERIDAEFVYYIEFENGATLASLTEDRECAS